MPPQQPRRTVPGRTFVTRRALEEVVRAAALGSYGVTGLAEPVLRRLGLGRRAIRVAMKKDVRVDVHLTIAHGLPVAEVARQVDSAIRYGLGRSLGHEVGSVTIHVDGLAGGPFTSPGDASPTPADDGAA